MATATDIGPLLAEAKTMGLVRPHPAHDVHCDHCAGRLDGKGDCPTCGVVGRSEAQLMERAKDDPEGIAKVLTTAIARRKGYKPLGREKSQER